MSAMPSLRRSARKRRPVPCSRARAPPKAAATSQRVGCPKKIGSFTYHARVINEQKDDCLGTSCPWFFAQNANYCACDVAHGCCLMSDVAVIEEPKEKKRLFAH